MGSLLEFMKSSWAEIRDRLREDDKQDEVDLTLHRDAEQDEE